jgi:hypothetical protein
MFWFVSYNIFYMKKGWTRFSRSTVSFLRAHVLSRVEGTVPRYIWRMRIGCGPFIVPRCRAFLLGVGSLTGGPDYPRGQPRMTTSPIQRAI